MIDLISREELKKDLKQYFTDGVLDGVSAKLVFNQILHDIDNAPTVPLPDFKEGYKQAIIDGKTNYSRPQGEWIGRGNGTIINYGRSCSLCGKVVEFSENYCPRCGAYMKGGAE